MIKFILIVCIDFVIEFYRGGLEVMIKIEVVDTWISSVGVGGMLGV